MSWRDNFIAKWDVGTSSAYVGFYATSGVLGDDFFASPAHGMTRDEAVDVLIEQIDDWEERKAA